MADIDAPLDTASADRLRERGLRLGLVDPGDAAAIGAWVEAEMRGFHYGRPAAGERAARAAGFRGRRVTGVWDDEVPGESGEPASDDGPGRPGRAPGDRPAAGGAPEADGIGGGATTAPVPVATVCGYRSPLTVSPGRSVDAWAISAVTVAPTHRRRGIARALLEAELRTAHRLGLPVAALTVTEATIYGRYGFGPATRSRELTIDPRRASWVTPAPGGRLRFVTPESLHSDARDLFAKALLRTPGEVAPDEGIWNEALGREEPDEDRRALRAVRYDDERGVPQGFALYRLSHAGDDLDHNSCHVRCLAAATDDAYAALFRFVSEMDLVDAVTVPTRSADEALPWHLADPRAVRSAKDQDHLWLRILDVPGALEARRFSAPGRLALTVNDPLGLAAGTWMLTVDGEGAGRVEAVEGRPPAGTAALTLGASELGSLYLGGTRAATLARAGRIRADDESARLADSMLRPESTPWLSTWF